MHRFQPENLVFQTFARTYLQLLNTLKVPNNLKVKAMKEDFWNTQFSQSKLIWGGDPSDSAILSASLFKQKGLRKILIPGIGYGRNARAFEGFDITGIEISSRAIVQARELGFSFPIHLGDVREMSFDNLKYHAIYCYSLLHLFNKKERLNLLRQCYAQLEPAGLMVFVVLSKKNEIYNTGRKTSDNRYLIENGLKIFFYEPHSIRQEFKEFGLIKFIQIEEPIKYQQNQEPLNFWYVVCRKSSISKYLAN